MWGGWFTIEKDTDTATVTQPGTNSNMFPTGVYNTHQVIRHSCLVSVGSLWPFCVWGSPVIAMISRVSIIYNKYLYFSIAVTGVYMTFMSVIQHLMVSMVSTGAIYIYTPIWKCSWALTTYLWYTQTGVNWPHQNYVWCPCSSKSSQNTN